MLASLKVEAIGDNTTSMINEGSRVIDAAVPGAGEYFRIPSRHWAAEITGRDDRYGYSRQFLKGKKDYSCSNSVGSRGVFVHYILESGKVYEVKAPVSWKRSDRYFCRVTEAGDIERLTEDEVEAWLDSI